MRSPVAAEKSGSRCMPGLPAGQGLAGLCQALMTPVQDVIVGQHAAVDRGGRQNRHVARMHPVVDLLGSGLFAGGDARFEIDDPEIR
jgi:hypothetical protein